MLAALFSVPFGYQLNNSQCVSLSFSGNNFAFTPGVVATQHVRSANCPTKLAVTATALGKRGPDRGRHREDAFLAA